MAAEADGDFVVAWNSFGQDGASFGVFARRFSSAGVPLAGEFQVNTYTTSSQLTASVAADAGGDFVVAWGAMARTARSAASSRSASQRPPSLTSTPTARSLL